MLHTSLEAARKAGACTDGIKAVRNSLPRGWKEETPVPLWRVCKADSDHFFFALYSCCLEEKVHILSHIQVLAQLVLDDAFKKLSKVPSVFYDYEKGRTKPGDYTAHKTFETLWDYTRDVYEAGSVSGAIDSLKELLEESDPVWDNLWRLVKRAWGAAPPLSRENSQGA